MIVEKVMEEEVDNIIYNNIIATCLIYKPQIVVVLTFMANWI